MSITIRADKGAELTHTEMDTNFTDLRDGVDLMVPKTQGTGIKVDSLGTPAFGWHSIASLIQTSTTDGASAAEFTTYRGGIKQHQFSESKVGYVDFLMPHDYAMGTDVFIDWHWSHNSAFVTGGTVTWGIEASHAKGYDQGTFHAPKFTTATTNASTTQYQNEDAETTFSVSGASATQHNTDHFEPGSIIMARIYLDSNDIIVSSGGIPDPFLHLVTLNYQSTGVPTKNRDPGFWD